MKIIEFQIEDKDAVSLGDWSHNIKLCRGIDPERFIEIYTYISENFDFFITEEFLSSCIIEKNVFGRKQKFRFSPIHDIIDFLLECNILLEREIDIKPLIKEYKNSSDITEFHHTVSLAYITSVYASNSYRIEFIPKSDTSKKPDFSINGIISDLKVIQGPDWIEIHRKEGKREIEFGLDESLCYDIGTAIRNRVSEGIQQGDLIFIDLSNKSPTMLYLQEKFDTKFNIIPTPKEYRIIYFCRIGPNILLHRKGTFSFYGFYVDFDKSIWNEIRNNKTVIKHKMGEGSSIE